MELLMAEKEKKKPILGNVTNRWSITAPTRLYWTVAQVYLKGTTILVLFLLLSQGEWLSLYQKEYVICIQISLIITTAQKSTMYEYVQRIHTHIPNTQREIFKFSLCPKTQTF
jgi:hypothetical protein